jgi:hypothetical protein
MERCSSYLDWEKSFKKSSEKKKKTPKEIRILNSIGLPAESFASYLKSWKSKNMSKNF